MKWTLFTCVILLSCNNQPHAPQQNRGSDSSVQLPQPATSDTDTVPADSLIVPGVALSRWRLGASASTLQALGQPDMSDAAMGKAWLTWNGPRDEHNNATVLNVYTTYADSTMTEKSIQQLRTTSAGFTTAAGIHVYASLNEIKTQFPSIQKLATYNEDGRDIIIYDAVNEGIAFEVAQAAGQQICTGIIIHEKKKKVTDIYITQHPQMKTF